MPRQLTAEMTFDAFEDEVLFTRAALQADERAATLLSRTETWLGWVSESRGKDLEVRQEIANASAMRVVNNTNLDATCSSFADNLLLAVGKDRSSPRWTGFYKDTPSRFNSRPLSEQVKTVLSWLRSSTDAVLETFRSELTKWVTGAETALQKTEDLKQLRAQNWQRREELARNLTDDRDRLRAELAEIARQNNLGRDWPDIFFKVVSRDSGKSETDKAPESA